MSRRDTLLALVVALVWGLNFVVIEWGMAGVPPLVFLAVRFVVVALPAVFLVPRPAAPWRTVALIGALMSLGQFGLLYASLHAGMPPGLAALVLQAQVLLTIVIAAGVLGERPGVRQLGGVLLGCAGLGVVAVGREATTPLLALLLCLGGALSWALGNVAARASGITGGLGLTVWSGLVVPVPALGLALVLDGPGVVGAALTGLGWEAVVSTLYTAGLASLVGYGIFNSLLGRYAAAQVVPWILLVPVVAMASAWVLLGERPNGAEALGGLVLLVGAGIALAPRRQRPDSVYAGPSPATLTSAARTRRAVKSAQRSATSSGVQKARPRISFSWRTTRDTSASASCTPPSNTSVTASSQPLHGGSQSVSSSRPAGMSSASSSSTSRDVATCGDSLTSTTPPGRSQSRL